MDKVNCCNVYTLSSHTVAVIRRDKVTMFSGHQIVASCIMAIFVVAIPFRHRGNNFFVILLATEALTRF